MVGGQHSLYTPSDFKQGALKAYLKNPSQQGKAYRKQLALHTVNVTLLNGPQ